MGDSTDAAAGHHLRLLELESDLTPRRKPHDGQPRPRNGLPGTLLDLGILDHLEQTGAELAAVAAALTPDTAPVPSRPATAALAGFEASTAHLTGRQARIRDELLLRQSLETAILAGDRTVIRRITCPNCDCLGMCWQPISRKAVCVNRFCAKATGGTYAVWTLAELARHQVRNRTSRANTAT